MHTRSIDLRLVITIPSMLVVIFLAGGCQSGPPVAAQAGSRAPRAGFAIVKNGDDAVVDMINARFFDEYTNPDQSFTIQAGTCDLGVTYRGRETSEIKLLTFDAQPGQTYTFKTRIGIIIPQFQVSRLRHDQWDVQIINAADGTVVAETNDIKKQGGF